MPNKYWNEERFRKAATSLGAEVSIWAGDVEGLPGPGRLCAFVSAGVLIFDVNEGVSMYPLAKDFPYRVKK